MNDKNFESAFISDAEIVEIPRESSLLNDGSENILDNTEIEKNEKDRKFLDLIADFTEQIRENNRLSSERERIIDWLHNENQRLKQGELQQALLPIFRDLIWLYDDLKTTTESYAEKVESNSRNPVKDFSNYCEIIKDILYRYGVEPIEAKIGEEFNPKEHKAIGTIHADDEVQDRKISKIVREGFKTETKIVRSVQVEVYRYIGPAVEKSEEQNKNTLETIENKSEA